MNKKSTKITYFSIVCLEIELLLCSDHSQVSDVFLEKVVGITCYKHEFGIFGKGKNSRIRFLMFPTWEIVFGGHVTLVLKVIDFLQKRIITLCVALTKKLS